MNRLEFLQDSYLSSFDDEVEKIALMSASKYKKKATGFIAKLLRSKGKMDRKLKRLKSALKKHEGKRKFRSVRDLSDTELKNIVKRREVLK